jgi:nucleoside-diphosphate-sugar epimerase
MQVAYKAYKLNYCRLRCQLSDQCIAWSVVTLPALSNMARKNVLVIGANGYIGSAVCRAFVRAGWRVFGLIRRPEAARELILNETTPIIGAVSDVNSVYDALLAHSDTFDVIVGCIEPADYISYTQDAIALIRRIAEMSNTHHVRPLVLWSSGCKDYGTTDVDGAPGLAPHTEDSPLNPPSLLVSRATYSPKILEQTDLFDGAVLRPTNVFGHSSSYFGSIFEYAATAAANGARVLSLKGVDPKSIMHASKYIQ